jgi:hypothetical protein
MKQYFHFRSLAFWLVGGGLATMALVVFRSAETTIITTVVPGIPVVEQAQQTKELSHGLESFHHATEWTIFSLDVREIRNPAQGDVELFHNWPVLGTTTVSTNAALRESIVALDACSEGLSASCFEPRHGIRVVNAGETFDLLICYHCSSAVVFSKESVVARFGFMLRDSTLRPSSNAIDAVLDQKGITRCP